MKSMNANTPSVCAVKPVGKDRLLLVPQPGYEVVIFWLRDGGAEAILTDKNCTETIRLKIDQPSAGRKLAAVRNDDGSVEIIYHELKELTQ